MSFVSLQVLGLLLLAVFCARLLPHAALPLGIIFSGSVFLAVFSPASLLILSLSTITTWLLCGRVPPDGKRVGLLYAILLPLFFVFKIRSAEAYGSVAVPLGLAYYLLRQLHYAVEAWKGQLRPHSLIEFFSYLFLAPPLGVGPIHRFPDFLRDLRRHRWDGSRFSLGLERAFHGYAKLIIIANYLLSYELVGRVPALTVEATDLTSKLICSGYAWLDLYVRFSACSDIAIGVSAMMGFTLIENFRSPFLARNITEFWQRWHISLSEWCREYVFNPTAAVSRNRFLAVCLSMCAIGLWHEVSLRYLLWGLYHSLGILLHSWWHSWRSAKPESDSMLLRLTGRVCATLLTWLFVVSSNVVTTAAQDFILSIIGGK